MAFNTFQPSCVSANILSEGVFYRTCCIRKQFGVHLRKSLLLEENCMVCWINSQLMFVLREMLSKFLREHCISLSGEYANTCHIDKDNIVTLTHFWVRIHLKFKSSFLTFQRNRWAIWLQIKHEQKQRDYPESICKNAVVKHCGTGDNHSFIRMFCKDEWQPNALQTNDTLTITLQPDTLYVCRL